VQNRKRLSAGVLQGVGEVQSPQNALGNVHRDGHGKDLGGAGEELQQVPPEKLAELRDSGALEKIYNHLASLIGWDRLIAVASVRQMAAAQAGAPPQAANLQ